MTECKRCHAVDTMFWWSVSFGDWEDRFYLCDDCMRKLLEFLQNKLEKDSEPGRKCPSCGARLWLVSPISGVYGCPSCFRKYDKYGKEVPQ